LSAVPLTARVADFSDSSDVMRNWRVRVMACTAVGTVACACAGHAQAAGSVEVGAYGQVTGVDPAQARFETRTPLSLGLRGRVNLHRGYGIELEASTGVVDGAGEPLRRRYNQLVARGTFTHALSEFSGLVLGAGVARSDYEVTYNFGPSALIGVRTLVRGRYALRSDALLNFLPASGAREFGLRTGVQVVLGPFDGPTTRDRRRANRTMQEPGSIELGVVGRQWALDPVWNLRSGRAIGARVGAFITSRSAVEVDATYGRQQVRTGGHAGQTGQLLAAGATFRVTTFAFRYAHNLPIGTHAALVGGIGPSRSSVEYIDYWGGSALAGGRLALTRDIHLRGDVVAQYLVAPRILEYAMQVGVSTVVRLGR
jgi:hypothetical protein